MVKDQKLNPKQKILFDVSRIVNIHKFVVEKDLEKLRSVSVKDLVDFKNKLTNAEFNIKSGELEAEIALELAILS